MASSEEFRNQVALQINCCSCGGVQVLAVPCQEMEFDDGYAKLAQPLSFTLVNSELAGCPEPTAQMVLGPSSFADLYDDILKSLEAIHQPLIDEERESLQQAIQDMIGEVLASDLQNLQNPN